MPEKTRREKPLCTNCGRKPAYVKGLCRACYHYQRTTGEARPVSYAERTGDGLTPQERRIMGLLADGKTRIEIGELLCIVKRTVDYHVASVYDKLQVHSITQALKRLREEQP